MKKLLPLFAMLVLVGFGCNTKPVDTNSQPTPENGSVTFESQNADGTTTTGEMNGNEVTEYDEDGVPIINITLGGDSTSVRTIDLKASNTAFTPKLINAKPGEKIRIDFRGVKGTHTFVLPAANVKQDIKDLDGFEFTVPTEPGEYPYYCDIGDHRAKGMEGTLIVK